MTADRTQFVPTSIGPIACHIRGAGPVIVLLHANPGDARDYDAVVDDLCARGPRPAHLGRGDPILPLRSDGRRAARLLPRSQPARFWSGHEPHAEVPTEWLAAVQRVPGDPLSHREGCNPADTDVRRGSVVETSQDDCRARSQRPARRPGAREPPPG